MACASGWREDSIATFPPHIVFEYNAEYASRGGGDARALEGFFSEAPLSTVRYSTGLGRGDST